MKIYEIVPGKLYQSKKTNDEELNDVLRLIRPLGIDIIVNMWHTKDYSLVKWVDEYIHFSQPDGRHIDFDGYVRMAAYLANRIDEGHCVLSHCYGGRNRSGLLNAIIVMHLLNINGKEAHKFILSKRPGSLVNKSFCKLLDTLELV